MKPGYRDKLIMHAFYPKRVPFFNSAALKTILFYAGMFELAERGILKAEDNCIYCRDTETGDEVMDRIIALILPISGKKTGKLQMLVQQKAGGVYNAQMEQMMQKMYLTGEDITFLFWKVGVRYRVRKYDLLKPSVKSMERFLVYGRKPDRESWLTALLVAEAGLFRNIFSTTEFRQNATRRFKEMLKSDFHYDDKTISTLHRNLRKTLAAQKAAQTRTKGIFIPWGAIPLKSVASYSPGA
jgi:hypothetical protein